MAPSVPAGMSRPPWIGTVVRHVPHWMIACEPRRRSSIQPAALTNPGLRVAPRHRRRTTMGTRHRTRSAVVVQEVEEVVEHPQQGDAVDLVSATWRTISVQSLGARSASRVSAMQGDVVATENLTEELRHSGVLSEREPALSCGRVLVHLNVKCGTRSGRSEGRTQVLDRGRCEKLASHYVPEVAELRCPVARVRREVSVAAIRHTGIFCTTTRWVQTRILQRGSCSRWRTGGPEPVLDLIGGEPDQPSSAWRLGALNLALRAGRSAATVRPGGDRSAPGAAVDSAGE